MKISTCKYPVLLLFILSIVAACQDGQKDKQATSSTDTTQSVTVSPVPDSSATASLPIDAEDTAMVADGESVDPADEKDSVTYCNINRFYEKNGHTYIDADFLQLYIGEKAKEVARKHKDEVLDGVYMLNENATIRSLAIADDATYMVLRNTPAKVVAVAAPKEILLKRFQGNKVYVLTIDKNTNTITKVKEQYFP